MELLPLDSSIPIPEGLLWTSQVVFLTTAGWWSWGLFEKQQSGTGMQLGIKWDMEMTHLGVEDENVSETIWKSEEFYSQKRENGRENKDHHPNNVFLGIIILWLIEKVQKPRTTSCGVKSSYRKKKFCFVLSHFSSLSMHCWGCCRVQRFHQHD